MKYVNNIGEMANLLPLLSETIELNNKKNTQIFEIKAAEKTAYNNINANEKANKRAIDFYYQQIINSMESKHLNSSEKKKLFMYFYEKFSQI